MQQNCKVLGNHRKTSLTRKVHGSAKVFVVQMFQIFLYMTEREIGSSFHWILKLEIKGDIV